MNEPVTMHTGPLGSTVHVLRADAETVAALAGVDWSRHFRRVCLDPVRGVITLMSPSRLHEDLSLILDDIVDIAGSMITRGSKGLRSTRLRGRGEPPGTGMEPDCAFYVGERARGPISWRCGRGMRRPTSSSSATPPISWWKPRLRTAMPARPNATRRWECRSCGDCMAGRVPRSCGRSSSS